MIFSKEKYNIEIRITLSAEIKNNYLIQGFLYTVYNSTTLNTSNFKVILFIYHIQDKYHNNKLLLY